jgi:hypothetical protein
MGSGVCGLAEIFEGGQGAAFVEGAGGERPGFGGIFCESGNGEGGGGVEEDGGARGGAVGAVEDREEDAGVCCGVAAEEVGGGDGAEIEISGVDFEFAKGAVFKGVDLGFSEGGNFVEAQAIGAGSMDRPSAGAAEVFEDARVGGGELGIEDAGELEFGTGGIEERAENVEDAGLASLSEEFADRHDGFECGMAGRCEEEAATGILKGLLGDFGGAVDSHAEGLEDIGPAGFRGDASIAMFDDSGSGSGGDEHHGGGDVEEAGLVTARAADIDRALACEGEFDGALEEDFDELGNLVGRLAATMQGLQEFGAGLYRVRFVEEVIAGYLDFLAGEGSSGDFCGEFGEFHLDINK